ncbi:hypothetical protein [Roseofilum capinflatum]|uniref:Uncharacterized protein n=1 Tax=Roseofilum capinflatum BLCC-M114 TaxID=3022440 RepID=A0ABT7B6A1_9CYAN|nr:hypothetical protein [Roseofilum capinflatum]MDJ1174708.1 hypothetical protein [Roseofilum capinflatum BLCC-M114]
MTENIYDFSQPILEGAKAFMNGLKPEGYCNITQAEMDIISEAVGTEYGSEVLQAFNAISTFAELAGIEVADETELIAAKFTAQEICETLYGPMIFSKDGDLVIRFGGNMAKVEQEGESFRCGDLRCKQFKSLSVPGESGGSYEKFFLSFQSADKKSIFKCQVLTPKGSDFSSDDIELAIESGRKLAEFARPFTSGGGFVKLRDLDIGSYKLKGVRYDENLKFIKWELILEDGRGVTPNSEIAKTIVALSQSMSVEEISKLYAGGMLMITDKQEKAGKTYTKALISAGKSFAKVNGNGKANGKGAPKPLELKPANAVTPTKAAVPVTANGAPETIEASELGDSEVFF